MERPAWTGRLDDPSRRIYRFGGGLFLTIVAGAFLPSP
jgi:hypothetical protein